MYLRKGIGTGLVLLVLGWAITGAVSAAAQARGGGAAAPAAGQGRGGGGGNQPNPTAVTQPVPAAQMREDKSNMELVGFNDLQGRSAYQPTIHHQGNRYIAYVGHHGGSAVNTLTGANEQNGTLVIDVTDPKMPRTLTHVPGEATPQGQGEGAQMVRVCDGSVLPRGDRSKVYMLRSFGGSAHEMWDVTDPAKPVRMNVIVDGLRDTHKNFWECNTGIAYLVGGAPQWRADRMTMIYDLSDPAKPVFIRNFGLVGQQPGSTGPVPTDVHGPISLGPNSNRIYFGFGTGSNSIVQIVDREKLLNGPKEPTEANLLYPQIARIDLPPDKGAHTAFPLIGMEVAEFAKQRPRAGRGGAAADAHAGGGPPPEPSQSRRNFIAVVGESTGNVCLENRQMMWMMDITTEDKPFGVSTFNVPESPGGFCERGGRFGAHASQENMTSHYYRRIVFLSFFNAGVRAVDIRDPLNPKEIGYYIPAVTAKTQNRCAAGVCKIAIQTNNVEVDDRGYVYIVDRANTGMHILQLTGSARQVASGLPNLPNN